LTRFLRIKAGSGSAKAAVIAAARRPVALRRSPVFGRLLAAVCAAFGVCADVVVACFLEAGFGVGFGVGVGVGFGVGVGVGVGFTGGLTGGLIGGLIGAV